MKTLKSLFMLCAGLSFCACSSDNEPQLPEGSGAVTVKIASPLTRTVMSPYGAVEVADGDVTVTLYCGNPLSKHSSVTIDTSTGEVAKFWDVVDPKLVTASIHGGLAPEASIALEGKGNYGNIDLYQMAPDGNVPAYGETNAFTPTANSETHEGQSYQMYSAEIEMQVPFARLEFTIGRSDADSGFETLELGGVYLDNLLLSGEATTPTNTKHPDDVNFAGFTTTAKTTDSPLYDTAPAGFSFTEKSVVAPTDGKVYAYNIFPATTVGDMPIFKVWFKNATDTPQVLPYQYAIIAQYGDLSSFEAGNIYKITAGGLTDANIIPTEDGDPALYGVNVTVEKASWTVVEKNATWQ